MDDNQQQEDQVQEGEIVTEEAKITVAGADLPQEDPNTSVMVLDSLQSLIKENLAKVDKLTEDLGKQKEMLESVLENDETYKQHADAAKAATKVKTNTKGEILKRPDVAHVNAKVKELSAEIAEIKEAQTSYLQEYMRLSGSNEIETENGEVLQIVTQARVVRRRA